MSKDKPNLPSLAVTTATLGLFVAPAAPAQVMVTVKETASVGIQDYPTTVVVPFAEGQVGSTSELGMDVPVQFEVLVRRNALS